MCADMSWRSPPSRPFLNLLRVPVHLPLCAASCERFLTCPLLLSAHFVTSTASAVKPLGARPRLALSSCARPVEHRTHGVIDVAEHWRCGSTRAAPALRGQGRSAWRSLASPPGWLRVCARWVKLAHGVALGSCQLSSGAAKGPWQPRGNNRCQGPSGVGSSLSGGSPTGYRRAVREIPNRVIAMRESNAPSPPVSQSAAITSSGGNNLLPRVQQIIERATHLVYSRFDGSVIRVADAGFGRDCGFTLAPGRGATAGHRRRHLTIRLGQTGRIPARTERHPHQALNAHIGAARYPASSPPAGPLCLTPSASPPHRHTWSGLLSTTIPSQGELYDAPWPR